METPEILWIVAVVAASSFAQSLAGFGFGLLAVPMMSLMVTPHDAVVVATLIGAVSTTTQAVIDRQACEWGVARRMSVAAYAGMPIGLLAFVVVSEATMRFVLGVVVMIATLVLARGFVARTQSRTLDAVMGFLSGVLSTSTSTNGPPLVFLLQARGMPAQTFRATLNSVFAISNIGAVSLFAVSGHVTLDGCVAATVSLPVLFVALRAGYAVRPRVDAGTFRVLVLVLLFVSGISVLSSAFF